MMQLLFHKVWFQGLYSYSRPFVGAPFFKTFMYVLLYALECILMYLQTCTYALVHRLSNAFRYVPKNKHAYYFFCNYGHFLGFFMLFFGISIAINTNLTEIFSKIFLILFLILSRSTGAILGNFGPF